MPQFRKNVLSQYMRTKCDKQLRLSLYSPPELQALHWPVPLEARPAVQILRDRGKEWEQAKMQDLEAAFGTNLRGAKENGKFKKIELAPILSANPGSPTIIVQARFSHPDLRQTFLGNIGLSLQRIGIIPAFGAFEPDIVLVRTAADDEVEILPNGDTVLIATGNQRKALLVSDIKHAGEANSSYSSEVALYAVLLANWLRLNHLDDRFLVADRLGLWTRAKEISGLAELVASNPGAGITERLQAFLGDLEKVDFQIFFQTVSHFFNQDLPRVLALTDWTALDWHVDSRCSACDFLGHRNWLRASERAILDANRSHYCVTAAEDCGHLSRLATITRGSRKTLQQAGHANVTAVSIVTAADPVFDLHNALKADRNHLPHRATALLTGGVTIAPNTTTIDFPKYADLQIFLSVNFDPGTGLLCALGSEARFRQRVPFGQTSNIQKNWAAEAQTLLTSTIEEERNVVISFLSRLAEVFEFIHNPAADRGGAQAAKTRVQVYFWDARQFEELAKAIGRHLNSIVMQPERYLRGLAWLFPPEEILEEDEITLANPITFMKSVIQRDLRLPVAHCLTLFNVAEVYHDAQFPPYVPGSFYRDPFSDMIPRERIYEIWSQEPLVKVGTTHRTRSQCITDYSDAVKRQVTALRSVVWKFGADMTGRLHFDARPLKIGVPFNFQNMSEDGRLWYGWALLEEACKTVELRRSWASEPEELEASYSILRFSQFQATQPNGDLVYEVRPTSRDCKFRDSESFLALQDESIAGFLDLRPRNLLDQAALQPIGFEDRNRKMADIFSGELIELDRTALRAQIRLSTFRGAGTIRNILAAAGAVDISQNVSLIARDGPPMAERVRECLLAIGRPPMAQAAPATYAALGHAPATNLPRNDAVTPVARILWDATALGVEETGLADDLITSSIDAVAQANWPLNTSQRDAVSHCLSHRLSIVWGPPGTGKTTTAASLVAARILAARNSGQNLRILITGPTYTAWEKLFGEILELLERVHAAGLSCYRIYASTHPDRGPLPAIANVVHDIEARHSDPGFQGFWNELQNPGTIVLVGTVAHQCYRIAKQGNDTAMARLFDYLVVDESSQLDVGKSLFPLCLLAAQSEVALFGDHLQMPPVITTQPPRNAEWLVGSIQNYLLHRHGLSLQNLLINYRSASAFVEFGKRIGYPPGLSAHSPDLQLRRISEAAGLPVHWQDTVPWFSGLDEILNPERTLVAVTYEDGRAGQANDFEADIVCSMVQQLFLAFSQSLDGEKDATGQDIIPNHQAYDPTVFWDRGVGVVTPHRAQRALIVRRLREIFPTHDPRRIDAAVDTVERFQGGQRDTIIISFGVGDPDLISEEESFLLQLERTNVAISRARAKCILVISEDLAYHLPSDRETILTSKAVKTYVSDFCRELLPLQVGVGGNAQRQLTLRWHNSGH
jgi:AAA domain-containing protein